MKILKNKYYHIYRKIINRAKSLKRTKTDKVYYEKHHIIPSSLGGSDKSHNLILLTAREHFVVHACLVRIVKGRGYYKMVKAFDSMSMTSNNQKRYINSRLFEANKIKVVEANSYNMSGEKNHRYGKSDHTHGLVSRAKENKGKTFDDIYGEKKAIKIKKKLSDAQSKFWENITDEERLQSSKNLADCYTQERKDKHSKYMSNTGNPNSKIYSVYDSYNNLMMTIDGGFTKTLKELGMPHSAFNRALYKDGKVYDYDILDRHWKMVQNKNHDRYKGWYTTFNYRRDIINK